jgi:hypothetical protein
MSNSLYDRGREGFLAGEIDWDADNIKMVFIDHTDDTPDPDNDEDLADLGAAARVATSGNLSSKTVTDGVADAADETVSTVSGDEFESVNIYQDTGVEGTSLLIAYIDTATGLPCTPNGGDITVQWDSGANKIFKL